MRRFLLPFVFVGLCAYAVARAPRAALVVAAACALVGVALAALLPRWLARRRLHAIIEAGDVRELLRAWYRSAAGLANPETTIPLMIATAYASFGWVDEARRAREAIRPGAALGSSREQVEFVDVLLQVYDGDREEAVRRAEALLERVVPDGDSVLDRRATAFRRGLVAVARAFAHRATTDDAAALVAMREPVPILTWPLRYAEAVVALDAGDGARAARLLEQAPKWPESSVFATFHRELAGLVRAR